MVYLQLYFEFFKAGLFAVGGGLATLPFLEDIATKTGWFSHAQLADMIAISESTPGPIGINMATYAGYSAAGILGSIIATAGLITPCIIIILIVAGILKEFKSNRFVQNAFYGLRPASLALITAAVIPIAVMSLLRLSAYQSSGVFTDLFNFKAIALAIVLYFLIKKYKKLHPAVFLLISAVVGVLFRF